MTQETRYPAPADQLDKAIYVGHAKDNGEFDAYWKMINGKPIVIIVRPEHEGKRVSRHETMHGHDCAVQKATLMAEAMGLPTGPDISLCVKPAKGEIAQIVEQLDRIEGDGDPSLVLVIGGLGCWLIPQDDFVSDNDFLDDDATPENFLAKLAEVPVQEECGDDFDEIREELLEVVADQGGAELCSEYLRELADRLEAVEDDE